MDSRRAARYGEDLLVVDQHDALASDDLLTNFPNTENAEHFKPETHKFIGKNPRVASADPSG